MKKRILVTGAAGFIGYHLACFLYKRGDYVVGYDNFNDYYSPKLKHDRAKQLKEEGIEVLLGDICDRDTLEEIVDRLKITHIAHLAAQAGVRYSLINPHAYTKSNIDGFLTVLEICRHHPEIKLTYASSSSVYGLNKKTPFSETDPTDQQVSLYGATKKSNELFARSYHHLFGISVTGLRFFTVYGPWGRPDMAYYSFLKNITENKPIEVFNYGKLQRDFTYIDDIVSGTAAAIDLEAGCEIFNLGNHRPVELEKFLHVLEGAIGKKAKIELLPMQQGDVLATCADISHSQEKLHFYPKTSLEEGIAKFVDWYKEYHCRDSFTTVST